MPSSVTCHSTHSGTHGWRQVVIATGLGGVPRTSENRARSLATCSRVARSLSRCESHEDEIAALGWANSTCPLPS